MLQKTKGIVISYIKYGESSIIARLFTEQFGMGAYLVNGIRSAKTKKSIGYFQPFSILDLEVYFKPNRDIQRISEFRYYMPLPSLSRNIYKNTIALFLSEILNKLLRNDLDEQKTLYPFLEQSLSLLDQLNTGIENFHLHFLLNLAHHLGIGPASEDEFFSSMDMHPPDDHHRNLLKELLSTPAISLQSSGRLRHECLELLIAYFNHHGLTVGEVKSLKVLRQVFS